MIEDEGQERGESGDAAYDFFKYMTSLTLLTLGGVITVSQMAQPGDLKKTTLIIVLGTVALAAVASFLGAAEVVTSKAPHGPSAPHVRTYLKLAPTLFLVGIGAFLFMFGDVMY